MNATSPHLTLQELAAHATTGLSAAARRHLAECASCRARSRTVAADGVRFLVTRCQPPPGLIDHVLADIDARAPAGMTRRVTRRRRWRPALRSVAAVTAALAAGAVALAILVPGARHDGTGPPVLSTAYVVRQVNSALSAAEPGDIAHMTITTDGDAPAHGGPTAQEWSVGSQWRTMTYSAAGRPVTDEGVSDSSGYTVVSYLMKAWARPGRAGQLAPLLPSGQGLGPGLRSGSPVTVPGFLRHAVSHGSLTVAGRQRVDGIEAIKLTSPAGGLLSETVWVSPRTYLPVRVVSKPIPGQPGSGQTADITWLPATRQNLAMLTVPIPHGFRKLPLAEVTRQKTG